MDPELFIRPDGLPMAFVMSKESKDRAKIKDIVEISGGILIYPKEESRLKDNAIHLLGPHDAPTRGLEMVDYRFVLDCVKENSILDNMKDYHIKASKFSSIYDESYNPLDILLGYRRWSDLSQGETVSDIEDFGCEDIGTNVSPKKTSAFKLSKLPYSRRNQEEIVQYLVKFAAYKLVKGKAVWEKLEDLKVCKGERSWQSMKEHFRKQIIPQIHTFGLSWRQVRRFRSTYGLDEEHSSDIDSEEEEGVDNDARRSGLSLHKQNDKTEKSFNPQRTSSPSPVVKGASVEEMTNANSSSGAIDNDLCLRVSDDEDIIEDTDTSINPVKRKRKLFSTNCSYLEEDKSAIGEDPEEFDITPVRKQKKVMKILDDIIEEEDDEQMIIEVEEAQAQSNIHEDDANIISSSSKEVTDTDDRVLESGKDQSSKKEQQIDKVQVAESSVSKKHSIERSDTEEDAIPVDESPPLPPATRKSKVGNEDLDLSKGRLNEEIPDETADASANEISVTPTKSPGTRRKKLLLKTPPSVCCKKVNTVDLEAIKNLQPRKLEGRRKSSSTVEPAIMHSTESIEKENLDKDFWYKSKFRQPFRRGEDEAIVSYFMDNGGYNIKGGNTIWKKMEEAWICPGRTWGSMKERFEKHIELHLKSFGTSKKQLKEKDGQKAQVSGRGVRLNGNYYSKAEDVKIIKFIVDNRRFQDTKGNELWKVMEERNVLEGRTWQSMKERFRKVISIKINQYGFDKDIIKQFSTTHSKPVKEKRIN